MKHSLVVATNNRGKLEELRHLLAGLNVEVLSIQDVSKRPINVVEDGDTFEENAIKKAREVANATTMLTLADDSGLEVEALGGDPCSSTASAGLGGVGLPPRVPLLCEAISRPPSTYKGGPASDPGSGRRTVRAKAPGRAPLIRPCGPPSPAGGEGRQGPGTGTRGRSCDRLSPAGP